MSAQLRIFLWGRYIVKGNFLFFHEFEQNIYQFVVDFTWNRWNYANLTWSGFHNFEQKWNVNPWNIKNFFQAWIFRERKFTDPSLLYIRSAKSNNFNRFCRMFSATYLEINCRKLLQIGPTIMEKWKVIFLSRFDTRDFSGMKSTFIFLDTFTSSAG